MFNQIKRPDRLIEFGANVGMNLKAIKLLFPQVALFGVEINEKAASELTRFLGPENVFNGSIFDFHYPEKFDVSLSKGVLIHINPEMLPVAYEKLYQESKRYVLICVYYSPSPVTIHYRGHSNRLFKRDFAGEMMDRYEDLKLINYGFCYKRDNAFPQDDINWFLLKKGSE